MGAVGPGDAVDRVHVLDEDALVGLLRRQFAEADAAVGAGYGEATGRIDDVGGRRLERIGRQFLALVDKLLAAAQDGRAADIGRARPHRADAADAIGIAHGDLDLRRVDAEQFGRELREAGLQPLPHALGAHPDHHLAVFLDLVVRHLVHDVGRGPFDVGGEAAAVELAALLGLRLARRKAVPVGRFERLGEEQVEVAGIVLLAHRRGVGHLRGLHEVAPTQFGRIHAHLAGRRVHQPLEIEDALGTAGAAIGADRGGVGDDAGDLEIDQRDVIGAGCHLGADEQRDDDAAARRIGADVGEGFHAQAEDAAVLVECHRGLVELVAARGRRGKLLAALGAPPHRPLQHLGGPNGHRLVRLDADLHAEAAADVAHDHAHLVLGHLQDDVAQSVARHRGVLAADMDDQPVVLPLRHDRARLHGVHDQALVHDVERHDVGRALESLLGLGVVAELVVAGDVARRALPDLRRAGLERVLDLGDRRKLLILDIDQLEGVLRLLARVGDDGHHGLSDVAHHLVSQRTAGGHLGLAAVGRRKHRREGEVTHTFLFHVGPGVDRDHARCLFGCGSVDLQDFCVGMRRPHEHNMRLIGPREVVGEAARAGQEPVVLDALDVLSLAKHRHTPLPPQNPIRSAGL